jgi:glycosyltransferase involved in cell wall biosynthesis
LPIGWPRPAADGTSPLRILMINHEFTITGASTVFFRLARHLHRRGHAITIAPCNPADGPMKARYEALGIPVSSAIVPREFDLILANTIAAGPNVARLGPPHRTIWLVHEAEIGLSMILRNPSAFLPAFEAAAAVVYDMPFQHDVFRSFTYQLDQSKFHTVSCGVDIDRAAILRDAIPPKSRRFRVVQVGTLEPRKRPGDLVQAVASSGLDMECVICGKFFQIDDRAREIIAGDPERFCIIEGASDGEVLAWVESADMFCLASVSETQGLAAYEAALLARPLILSDLRCYRDVFTHGRNCLMFPAGNIALLAMSLKVLAAQPQMRETLGLAARKAAERYTNAAFFARFESVMVSVAPEYAV